MSGVRNAGSRAGHDGRARDDRCSNPFQLRNEDQDSPKVQVSLDREGFALLTHRSAVTDFVDEDQLRRTYYPEAERLVANLTGGARVVIFDHTVRRRVHGKADREPGIPRQPSTRI